MFCITLTQNRLIFFTPVNLEFLFHTKVGEEKKVEDTWEYYNYYFLTWLWSNSLSTLNLKFSVGNLKFKFVF